MNNGTQKQEITNNPQKIKRNQIVLFRCNLEEKAQIKANAQKCNLPTSRYVCNLALGYKPQSLEKLQERTRLHNQAADLGRLGGLLKMLLTNNNCAGAVGIRKIQILLRKIKQNQAKLKELAKKV